MGGDGAGVVGAGEGVGGARVGVGGAGEGVGGAGEGVGGARAGVGGAGEGVGGARAGVGRTREGVGGAGAGGKAQPPAALARGPRRPSGPTSRMSMTTLSSACRELRTSSSTSE